MSNLETMIRGYHAAADHAIETRRQHFAGSDLAQAAALIAQLPRDKWPELRAAHRSLCERLDVLRAEIRAELAAAGVECMNPMEATLREHERTTGVSVAAALAAADRGASPAQVWKEWAEMATLPTRPEELPRLRDPGVPEPMRSAIIENRKRSASLYAPDDLSDLGRKAHGVIMEYLRELRRTNTGGCQAFYSPAQWRVRGEEYGTRSVLVVVYDGGELRPIFSMDAAYEHDSATFRRPGYQPYEMLEEMQSRLRAVGLYFEECTRWYGAVYPVRR